MNEHNNTNTKPQAKKQWFLKLSKKFTKEKQQLVEENDADNNYKEGTLGIIHSVVLRIKVVLL